VEDRILVLNVLRGLSDRYAHLRTWITRQRPFPTFLEVRDDLVMEELTQGLQPGSTASPGASSTALAATPPRQSAPRTAAPPPSSLLGPPPSGPSGGGRGGRRRRGGGRGGGRGAPTQAPVPGGPQGGGTMALFPEPVVWAHLHVALPRHRDRLASTGGHAHRSTSRRLPCYAAYYAVGSSLRTFRGSTGGCGLGSGGPGSLVRHHGPDTSGRTRVDRRFGGHLPHHS
jgi:hypothetical protein